MLFFTLIGALCLAGSIHAQCANYAIQSGNTFNGIASAYGIPESCLAAANPGVNVNNLQINQEICVPSAAACAPGCTPYVVQPSDTYCSIAAAHGCANVATLEAANTEPAYDLTVSSTICIPSSCSGVGMSAQSVSGCQATTQAMCSYSHTVVSGDTYCQIAAEYGCPSLAALENANSQNALALTIGSSVCIPSSCSGVGMSTQSVSGCQATTCIATPTIASGNTFCGFASQYGCNVNTIEAANPSYAVLALPVGSPMCIPSGCAGQCAANINLNTNTLAYYSNMYNCNLAAYYASMGCPAPTSGTICVPANCAAYPYNGLYNGCVYCNGALLNGACTASGYCAANNVLYCNGNAMASTTGMCNGQFYCNGAAQASSTGMCGNTFYCNGAAQATTDAYCNGNYYCNGAPANGYCSVGSYAGYCFSSNSQVAYYAGSTAVASATQTTCASFAAAHGVSEALVALCNGFGTATSCTLNAGQSYNY